MSWWIKAGLLLTGLPQLLLGFWAYVAPLHFFENFPSQVEPWLPFFGPYDQHLVADFGALSAGLAAIVVFAAVRSERTVVIAAAWGWLLWSVPHFLTHVFLADHMTATAASKNFISTSLAVLVPVGVLFLLRAERRRATRTGPDLLEAIAP